MWGRKGRRRAFGNGFDLGLAVGEEIAREAVYRDVYLPVVDGLRARYKALADRHERVVRQLHTELWQQKDAVKRAKSETCGCGLW